MKKGEKKIVIPCDPILFVDPLNASLVWDKYKQIDRQSQAEENKWQQIFRLPSTAWQ